MSEITPLVSVIAICFNHEQFLFECLQSVVNQTYTNIELIIVDDFSQDNSRKKIIEFHEKNPLARIMFNEKNIGNCRSFNQAFKISKGKYIIDLSTDDVLLPNRIAEQITLFETSETIGVVFSDADMIDEFSNYLGNVRNNLHLPIGKVYEKILYGNLFTVPVSMMMRRTILEQLGGYDETLAYEDFDFWVRSSRICEYGYVPKVLSYQRILKGSHSTSSSLKHNLLIQSSAKICQKAFLLNETESENKALVHRLRQILIRSVFTENFESAKDILLMLNKLNGHNRLSRIFQIIAHLRLPVNPLYRILINIRRYIRFKI